MQRLLFLLPKIATVSWPDFKFSGENKDKYKRWSVRGMSVDMMMEFKPIVRKTIIMQRKLKT